MRKKDLLTSFDLVHRDAWENTPYSGGGGGGAATVIFSRLEGRVASKIVYCKIVPDFFLNLFFLSCWTQGKLVEGRP